MRGVCGSYTIYCNMSGREVYGLGFKVIDIRLTILIYINSKIKKDRNISKRWRATEEVGNRKKLQLITFATILMVLFIGKIYIMPDIFLFFKT